MKDRCTIASRSLRNRFSIASQPQRNFDTTTTRLFSLRKRLLHNRFAKRKQSKANQNHTYRTPSKTKSKAKQSKIHKNNLDVHLATRLVHLLTRQRVVKLEVLGELSLNLLPILVIEESVGVGDTKEEPRHALENRLRGEGGGWMLVA
jgi:hypothetical protein